MAGSRRAQYIGIQLEIEKRKKRKCLKREGKKLLSRTEFRNRVLRDLDKQREVG